MTKQSQKKSSARRKIDLPRVMTKIQNHEKIPVLLQLSLLPGIRDLLTAKEYNFLDGSLRRGHLECIKVEFLSEKLASFRNNNNVSAGAFYRLYQFTSFLKKFPIKGNDDICRQAAIEKFKEGEIQCSNTNESLSDIPFDSDRERIKSIIAEILGSIDLSMLRTKVEFGPGSTVNPVNRPYDESNKFFKFSDKLYVPARQLYDLKFHMSQQASWMEALRIHYHINENDRPRNIWYEEIFTKHLVPVEDSYPNKITFVPKNSDEHRAIGVELNGSILLQKCMGNAIRDRLKKFGLDLNTQSRNVHFARLAKTFDLATVDLANASNTLSIGAVKSLLPADWFAVLDSYRSWYGQTKEGDLTTKYSMFSSMGNGFTFELESLIFYALCLDAVSLVTKKHYKECMREVAVYGDDLIVPQDCYEQLVHHLTKYGFKVNHSKSFTSGSFFESCGSDFYDGYDVRPFFLKRELRTIKDLYFLCNSLLFRSIKSKQDFLFPAYIASIKVLLNHCRAPDLGPLHFEEGKDGWQENYDDLEAVLRVPLDFAQKHGGVRFDTTLFAWRYRKWVRVALEVPLSKNCQYHVQNMKYLTFLDGAREGKVVYKDRTRFKLVHRVSSNWNGTLSQRDLTLISELFDRAYVDG